MILVAGGTGMLGRQVVRLLVDAGHRVRVLTRDPERARDLPGEVDIVCGDVRTPASLPEAVRGCTTVVSAVHGFLGPGNPSPEAIDRDGNRALVRAASDARVEHFVLMSVHGASAEHPMSLHRAKYAAEEALRKSGLRFTIVRATAFLETWTSVIGGELGAKGQALVLGPGRNPINFVSIRDVAAVVARAVSGDAAMSNETVEIGGPENLGFLALAERIVEASGKPARIKHVPLFALRAMSLLARPFSPAFARQARAAVVMNTMDMTWSPSPSSTTRSVAEQQPDPRA